MEGSVTDDQEIQQELDFLIVSPKLTIEAMRASGYKDTDHALAELIDNSVEANADLVEIIAVETPADPQEKYARAKVSQIAVGDNGEGMDHTTRRALNSVEANADLVEIIAVETPADPQEKYARAKVSQIAVGDNGEGMDHTTLRRALKFGDGTRMDRRKQGIGRFGVGLPQSSISQCRLVDIWTWQNGPDNALHCYLDLDEIKTSGRQDVPDPTHDSVPDRWRGVVSITSEQTGTLVVWSKLDRVRWSGGEKTLERTAELCGQHLLGAPCFRAGFCSKTIIPDSEEHPLASSRAVPKDVVFTGSSLLMIRNRF